MSLIIPANSAAASGGYAVDNSVRLDGSSSYMTKSMGTPTNIDKYSFSFWVKRSKLGVQQSIFRSTNGAASNDSHVTFQADDTLRFEEYGGSASIGKLQTTQVFRDISAWYSILLVYDSGNGTAGNRMRMYVNGTEVTAFGTDNNPSQNADSFFNKSGETLSFGRTPYSGGGNYFSGYVAELVMCDGQALTPTDIGEFDEDSGIFKPINVSGLTFGTNGFYLDFEDSANLGNDANGGTDFTESGLAAVDQSTDTCTNNFATFNPLALSTSAPTLSKGNLRSYVDGSAWKASPSTMAMSKGKFYMEIKWISDSNTRYAQIGIVPSEQWEQQNSGYPQVSDMDNGYTYYSQDGTIYNNGSSNSYGNSYGPADSSNLGIVGIALDCDNNKLYFSKDGTWQNSGNPESGSTGTGAFSIADKEYYFILTSYAVGNIVFEANFGSPSFAISSGNADGNGYGNFEYAVPSGYYSLNTKNLAEYG